MALAHLVGKVPFWDDCTCHAVQMWNKRTFHWPLKTAATNKKLEIGWGGKSTCPTQTSHPHVQSACYESLDSALLAFPAVSCPSETVVTEQVPCFAVLVPPLSSPFRWKKFPWQIVELCSLPPSLVPALSAGSRGRGPQCGAQSALVVMEVEDIRRQRCLPTASSMWTSQLLPDPQRLDVSSPVLLARDALYFLASLAITQRGSTPTTAMQTRLGGAVPPLVRD